MHGWVGFYVPRLKGETWGTRAFEAVEAERDGRLWRG